MPLKFKGLRKASLLRCLGCLVASHSDLGSCSTISSRFFGVLALVLSRLGLVTCNHHRLASHATIVSNDMEPTFLRRYHTQWEENTYYYTSLISDRLNSAHLTSDRLTSPHLISAHLTSPQLTSDQLSSSHLTSAQLTSPQIRSPHFTSHQITSAHFTSA